MNWGRWDERNRRTLRESPQGLRIIGTRASDMETNIKYLRLEAHPRTALRASSSRFPSCLLPCATAASANGVPPGTALSSSPPAAAAAAAAAADFADLAAAACDAVIPQLLSLGSNNSSNSAELEKSPLLLYAREFRCTLSESVAQEEPRDDFFPGLLKQERNGASTGERAGAIRWRHEDR